jgi:hypothetical protein
MNTDLKTDFQFLGFGFLQFYSGLQLSCSAPATFLFTNGHAYSLSLAVYRSAGPLDHWHVYSIQFNVSGKPSITKWEMVRW